MDAICDKTAVELVGLLKRRALSPVELLEACLARIAAVNPAVNAVVTLDEQGARGPPPRRRKPRSCAADDRGPLHGLPVLIKDTQDTKGMRTTYGSPILADNVPAADQASVARLRAAGAIIFGKTNTPEWAAGANTRNPVFGATGNPFDPAAFGGRLLRRLGGGAGLRHGAARLRLRHRRLACAIRRPIPGSSACGRPRASSPATSAPMAGRTCRPTGRWRATSPTSR